MRNPARTNVDWTTPAGGPATPFQWEHVAIELLMDIRAELRALNAHLRCPNFVAIPSRLERIARNTAKPKGKNAKRKSAAK